MTTIEKENLKIKREINTLKKSIKSILVENKLGFISDDLMKIKIQNQTNN